MIEIPNIYKQIHKEQIYNVLENKYSIMGPMWVSYQMEWSNGIYASFKDHDKYLIIIFLIKKTLDFYSRNFTKLSYDDFYSKETVEIELFTITEVSKALNIPKESARRKVLELEEKGAIKKFKKKIIIDRSSYEYVKPVHTVKRISRFLSAVTRICEAQKVLPKRITTEQLELTIKNNFSYIWKIYYELQLPMMLSYKKLFRNLETFHVFGICAVNQHHTKVTNETSMSRDKFLSSLLSDKVQGINAMSISDITGIPRATVIRKLQLLVIAKNLSIDDKKLYKLTGNFTEKLKQPQNIVLDHLAIFASKVFNITSL